MDCSRLTRAGRTCKNPVRFDCSACAIPICGTHVTRNGRLVSCPACGAPAVPREERRYLTVRRMQPEHRPGSANGTGWDLAVPRRSVTA